MNPEVLIYLQQIKMYIDNNPTAKDYFIGNSQENIFYKKLEEISLLNFKNTDDPKLNKDQLESIRLSLLESPIRDVDMDLFFEVTGYGLVCKN